VALCVILNSAVIRCNSSAELNVTITFAKLCKNFLKTWKYLRSSKEFGAHLENPIYCILASFKQAAGETKGLALAGPQFEFLT